MNIPQEAIEAAHAQASRDISDEHRLRRDEVCRMLEAAAPYLMAQAWQEGVEAEVDRAKWDSIGPNPYRKETRCKEAS